MPALSSGVPVVTDVPDSSSSMVVLGEALVSGSDCEIVEPQSFFSLLKASSVLCGESRRPEL